MKKITLSGDIGLLILRLSLGIMMLMHGLSKLFGGLGWLKEMLSSMGMPSFFAYGVLIGEVLAPLMLIFGFKTRLGAILMAFNMIVAVAMAHSGDIFTLSATGGWSIELPALYFFGALTLVFTGPGKYSVDKISPF